MSTNVFLSLTGALLARWVWVNVSSSTVPVCTYIWTPTLYQCQYNIPSWQAFWVFSFCFWECTCWCAQFLPFIPVSEMGPDKIEPSVFRWAPNESALVWFYHRTGHLKGNGVASRVWVNVKFSGLPSTIKAFKLKIRVGTDSNTPTQGTTPLF